jgi:hypothetical protein
MRWYRKAQLAWFGVFAVVFMTIAWAVLPVTQLTTGQGTTLVLDHVMYTAIALVLAGLLAVAAGAETDYQDALRRYGFSSTEAFDPNKAMMYWMRVGAIVFLLAPFILLALEVEGHLQPISFTRSLLDQHMSTDGVNIFMLLYNSVYGLCVTLLAIDFFLTPLSAQIVRDEASYASKDQLVVQTFTVSSKFVNAMTAIVAQNVPDLRGTPNVWTKLMPVVEEADAIKRGASMLPLNLGVKNLAVEHITALQTSMKELAEFPKFLSDFDSEKRTAGKKNFKRVYARDVSTELVGLTQRVESICADLGLSPPPADKQSLDDSVNQLCAHWQRVRAAAMTHYNVKD